ncbi:DNA mismatch repair protein Msh3-like isoform X2 [Lytechinus pictus]|uniref:DNA mismatch repair protein Msh3-like isoform X2 n=2 Tax=Lytechinus pictus TaxID=7653 RepID=UPI0030B9C858
MSKAQTTISRFFAKKSAKKSGDTSNLNRHDNLQCTLSGDTFPRKRCRSFGEDEHFHQKSPKQLKLDGKILCNSDSQYGIPPLSAGTLKKLHAFAFSSQAESESNEIYQNTSKTPSSSSPANASNFPSITEETKGSRSSQDSNSETIKEESLASNLRPSVDCECGTPASIAKVSQCAESPRVKALENNSHSGSATTSVSARMMSPGSSDNVFGKNARVKKSQYTPLEQQFMKIKENYADSLLLVECGYRYRFFGQDAEIAAKELNIFCHHDHNYMTASIPTHRLFVHVRRLVAKGYKVGVVKQMETAALKAASDNKGQPFERKLTALYTKSTLIGEDLEPSFQTEEYTSDQIIFSSSPTSYLLCVCEFSDKEAKSTKNDQIQFGLAAVQPATGDVIYDCFHDNINLSELDTRLHHIQPVELLLPETLSDRTEKLIKDFRMSCLTEDSIRIERLPADVFQFTKAVEEVSSFYCNQTNTPNKATVLQTVLSLPKPVICCIAALVKYLAEFSLHRILQVASNMRAFTTSHDALRLDACALRNLEIFNNHVDGSEKGSLLWVLNHTKTQYGKRQFIQWLSQPLTDIQGIECRLDAVSELLESDYPSLNKLYQVLSRSPDVERGLSSIFHKKCSASQFVIVTRSLSRLSLAVKTVHETINIKSGLLKDIFTRVPSLLEGIESFLVAINETAVKDADKTKLFADPSQFPAVHKCMQEIEIVKNEMMEHKKRLRKEVTMPTAEFVSVSGNEYMIEIKKSQVKKVPKDWLQISSTKQVSRYRPPYIEESFKRLCQLREQLAAECQNAWLEFLEDFGEKYSSYRRAVQYLAQFDCLLSMATVSKQEGYCRPVIHEAPCKIEIKGGRHPIVSTLKAEQYVHNDTSINVDGLRCMIITGPNMGGKSCYIKQIALITIMAQLGCYVPAENASIGAIDAIYARMGASDNIFKNQSTFMSELQEASNIMAKATSRSLVIMDELGRGTSTHDGSAIAFATARHLINEVKCLTLFVTHYQPLAELSDHFPSHVGNYHMSFLLHDRQDDAGYHVERLTFLYQLVEGVASCSYGLNVARLAGIPDTILYKASSKSRDLEKSVTMINAANDFTVLWKKMRSDVDGLGDLKHLLAL